MGAVVTGDDGASEHIDPVTRILPTIMINMINLNADTLRLESLLSIYVSLHIVK